MLHAKMKYRCSVPLIILALVLVPVNCNNSTAETCYHCSMNNPKASTLGPELEGMSGYKRCCKGEVRDYFKSTHYKEIISNGTSVVVHENSSYEHYHSFISACAHYQPYGFGNTYINGNFFGDMEVAAFLAHVIGSKIYCGKKVATMEQLAQGSCYNEEINFNSNYCDERYQNIYPCVPGVEYYGRGPLPIYWNYNYGKASKDLSVDLLSHPEYIEQNTTLAFQVSLWRWMTPIKEDQPSAHNVFIGYWEPTKNDILANGDFGATMKVLYGDLVCGQDDNLSMENIILNYLNYLDTMGVTQGARSREMFSCAN
ncbi:chitinase-like protein 1 [Quercus robur]|uniref:chitinase-like protein 1 n=1 Tax=Quercus robur TaxID=38942 RepID=UPI002162D6A7|nr:chitinase-like protein 1 [Quercus robur]